MGVRDDEAHAVDAARLRPERNAFHPAWLSVSTQSTPTKRLWPVSSSPIAVTTAWDAERPSTRHFT